MGIRTTHVGSLPRSQAVADCLFAREKGMPLDEAAYDALMVEATAAIVRRQREVGIDLPSDGETSKISYATYIKDRLTGFDGDSRRLTLPITRASWSASPRPAARRATGVRAAWGPLR